METVLKSEREDIETQLLLEGIFRRYGYDFRGYDCAAVKPVIWSRARKEGLATISGFQEKILHDPACLGRFLADLSGGSAGMFDDPSFFSAFRRRVVPALRTYPSVRIWQIGSASGGDLYSLAILIWEEGLYEKSKIYVSNVNAEAPEQVRAGVFPGSSMKEYSRNALHYLESGGRRSLAEYYTEDGEHAVFHSSLKRNIVFTSHNLVTDSSYNEFNLILCRNVMVSFGQALKAHVYGLIHASLCRFGLLGLGDRECLDDSPYRGAYEPLEGFVKLYRRAL